MEDTGGLGIRRPVLREEQEEGPSMHSLQDDRQVKGDRVNVRAGGIEPESEAKALLGLLKRINATYPKRNLVVHSVWTPTDDPNIGRIQGVRVRGRLRVIDEPMSVNQLAEIAEEIRKVGSDMAAFMGRHNLTP